MDQPAPNPTEVLGSKPKAPLLIFAVALIIVLVAGVLIYYFFKLSKNPKTASISDVAIEVNGQQISKDFYNHRVEIQTNFYKVVSPNPAKLATVAKDEVEFETNALLMQEELAKNNAAVSDDEINKTVDLEKQEFEKKSATGSAISYESLLLSNYKMTMVDKKYIAKVQLMSAKINSLRPKKQLWGVWLKRPIPGDGPEKATPQQKAADEIVRQKAQKILAEVNSGGNLAEIASKYTEDAFSKPNGGKIGLIPDELPQPFSKATFASMAVVQKAYEDLDANQAEVIDYPMGFAIMKVTEVKGSWGYKDINDFLQKAKANAKVRVNVTIN